MGWSTHLPQVGGGGVSLVLAANSVSKALNRVEKIPICVVMNSNMRVSLFI